MPRTASPETQLPVITSMRFSSSPLRPVPRIGDKRTTKKHGEQIRVPETHRGMWVVNRGRQCYVWVSPEEAYRRHPHLQPKA